MNLPKSETHYVWKEFKTVEGEDSPRLLTPWGDPMQYEFAADFLFDSEEKAKEWKTEHAPDENWILCKQTVEPIEFVGEEETIEITYREFFKKATNEICNKAGVNPWYLNEGGNPNDLVDINWNVARMLGMNQVEFNRRLRSNGN